MTLTQTIIKSVTCKDSKRRSFITYHLNGVKVLRQKLPYNETQQAGNQHATIITDVYFKNNSIYQKRNGREVRFPVSKKVLSTFNIEMNQIIPLTQ